MIKVNVFYPNSEGATFDMEYYKTKHMPLAAERSAPACRGWTAESGLAGGAPCAPGLSEEDRGAGAAG
jgi:uncharacterized protein (TIGR02118 family)